MKSRPVTSAAVILIALGLGVAVLSIMTQGPRRAASEVVENRWQRVPTEDLLREIDIGSWRMIAEMLNRVATLEISPEEYGKVIEYALIYRDDPGHAETTSWVVKNAYDWARLAAMWGNERFRDHVVRAGEILVPEAAQMVVDGRGDQEVYGTEITAKDWCDTFSHVSIEALHAYMTVRIPPPSWSLRHNWAYVKQRTWDPVFSSQAALFVLARHGTTASPPGQLKLSLPAGLAGEWLRTQPADEATLLRFAEINMDPVTAPWGDALYGAGHEGDVRRGLLAVAIRLHLGQRRASVEEVFPGPGDDHSLGEEVHADALTLLSYLTWSRLHEGWVLASVDHPSWYVRDVAWKLIAKHSADLNGTPFVDKLVDRIEHGGEDPFKAHLRIMLDAGAGVDRLRAIATQRVRDRAERIVETGKVTDEDWRDHPYEWIAILVDADSTALNDAVEQAVLHPAAPDLPGVACFILSQRPSDRLAVELMDALYDHTDWYGQENGLRKSRSEATLWDALWDQRLSDAAFEAWIRSPAPDRQTSVEKSRFIETGLRSEQLRAEIALEHRIGRALELFLDDREHHSEKTLASIYALWKEPWDERWFDPVGDDYFGRFIEAYSGFEAWARDRDRR